MGAVPESLRKDFAASFCGLQHFEIPFGVKRGEKVKCNHWAINLMVASISNQRQVTTHRATTHLHIFIHGQRDRPIHTFGELIWHKASFNSPFLAHFQSINLSFDDAYQSLLSARSVYAVYIVYIPYIFNQRRR